MAGNTRKLHYKHIKDTATEHVGHKGDIWYDPNTTTLRFYNGEEGGQVAGDGYSSSDFIDYGAGPTDQDVAIDLTKKYHWICNLSSNSYIYTLADGEEGQVIEFFAASGLSGDDTSNIGINHVYCWNGSNQYVNEGRVARIFDNNDTNQFRTWTKARFLNGGWHFDHHILELDSYGP